MRTTTRTALRFVARATLLVPGVTAAIGVLAGVAAAAAAGPVAKGEGTVADGRFDPLVYFAYEEADPASWEPVFREYSRLLLNATEGGLQLGTVTFTVCPDLKDEADIWVLADSSGARAHVDGLGRSGEHITISQIHKSVGPGALGQFGLAHETGHYLFGLYDEYRGFVDGSRQASSLHFCSFESSTVSCLMDGGTTIAPQNLRTEFCTRPELGFPNTTHVTGVFAPGGRSVVTDQQYYRGRSCWEEIERDRTGGLVHPRNEPLQATPPHAPVVFDTTRYRGNLAVAIVLDRSGSMSAEGRLTQAVLGAKNGVGLLKDGESLALVSFADAPTVEFSARSMDAGKRAAASAALDGVVAGGGTRLGDAVRTAVDELDEVSGCVEFVLVVTDGASAEPDIDDPAVLRLLEDGEHQVFVVAVGSFPETEALTTAADRTGGRFFQVADAAELPAAIASVFALAGQGTALLEDFAATLDPGETLTRTFEVPAGVERLRVDLSFEADADPELVLISPGGVPRRPPVASAAQLAGAAPDGHASAVQRLIDVEAPEAGAWTAQVVERQGRSVPYDLLAFVEGRTLDVSTHAVASRVQYPAPMQVSLSVTAGVPVAGARVEGSVRRPDGTDVPVTLHDDGLAVHGDERAGDGVYGTLFARYSGDGPYTFRLGVDARDGAAASDLACGVFGGLGHEEGGEQPGVAAFAARATHTLVLTGQVGVPTRGVARLSAHDALRPLAAVELVRAATPVGGFRIRVGPEEPLVLGDVTLAVESPGDDRSEAERVTLHRDRDGDGALDVPSVPLARGELSGDGLGLRFRRPGGELAFLAAGEEHGFLLVAGDGFEPQPEPESPFGGPPGGPPGGPGSPGAGGTLGAASGTGGLPRPGATLIVAFAALALLLLRRSTRLRRLALGGGAALLFLCVPACHGDAGGRDPDALVLTVRPIGLPLEGAVTGEPVTATGGDETSVFRVD